jgi:hypothetical protein
MAIHQTQSFAAVTTVAVTGLTAAAPLRVRTDAGVTHVVRPGESIQRAVDGAAPGDTVPVRPGTYRESVLAKVSRLTVRGLGRSTVIMQGTGTPANVCVAAGNGVCVTGTAEHRVTNVRIPSLAVSGFQKNGVRGYETDRLTVDRVLSENNGQQDIGQEKSTRGVFTGNTSRNNAESGVFLTNTVSEEGGATNTQGAVVRGNELSGNRIGVAIRRLRNLTVERNGITGNCGGVFVVGDEGTPRGGALAVSHNRVFANNRFCPKTGVWTSSRTPGSCPAVSRRPWRPGTRSETTWAPPTMAGGVVLYASLVGIANTGNTVSRNAALGNHPADLANRDAAGTGNTFTDSLCRISEPAGLCSKAAS